MNSGEWLRVALVLAGLLGGMLAVRAISLRFHWPAEVSRKVVHVAMGLTCAAFPWIFSRPQPVWMLAVLATLPLALVRWVPRLRDGVGEVLHGVKRPSYGEVLFAPAIACVFQLADGRVLLHTIPVGILALADAAGALAGKRFGRHRYHCGEGEKSVEGSLVFFLAAFLCVALPLALTGTCDAWRAVGIGLIMAILTMMAEGLSDRGFDNLVIPVGAFFVLQRLLPLEMLPLAVRFAVAMVLLLIVSCGSRWSTLSGGALLGAALFGYGCAILADPRFVLPPLALFACHLVTSRKLHLRESLDHRLDAVLSQAIAVLPWVIAVERGWIGAEMGLAGASFATATQLAILDASTRWLQGPENLRPVRSMAKGWLIAGSVGLLWLWRDMDMLAWPLAAALACSLIVTCAFQKIRRFFPGDTTGLWISKGTLSLISSLPACWFHP